MYRIIILISTLIFAAQVINPQNNQETPTPAPTKTATEPNIAEEHEPEVTTEANNEEVNSNTTTSSRIRPFTQADLTVLIGNVQRPNGLVWFEDKLYAVCNGDWTLYEIQATSGSTRTYVRGIRNAHTLHAEPIGQNNVDLWIPDYETNTLFRVNAGGAPQAITRELQGPWGIDKLDESHFLVTNLISGTIAQVSRTGEITEIAGDLRSPAGIVIDEDYTYVANNGSARRSIEWFNTEELTNGNNPLPEPLVTGLQNTTGLAMGHDGYVYFTYALGTRGVVGRLDPEFCRENGGCTNDQIEIVIYTELAAPLAGLTISDDMRLYIHTIFRPEIYWVQLENITDTEQTDIG